MKILNINMWKQNLEVRQGKKTWIYFILFGYNFGIMDQILPLLMLKKGKICVLKKMRHISRA